MLETGLARGALGIVLSLVITRFLGLDGSAWSAGTTAIRVLALLGGLLVAAYLLPGTVLASMSLLALGGVTTVIGLRLVRAQRPSETDMGLRGTGWIIVAVGLVEWLSLLF